MKSQARSPVELRSVFGENLRRLAEGHASVSELSRQLGINRTQFNRYLSGESFPRPDVLDRICQYFSVDARILLEPVETLSPGGKIMNGPFLADYFGASAQRVPEDIFPSGFYNFTRRSFVTPDQYVEGLVYIFRDEHGVTFVKGFEAKEALQFQGLPTTTSTREFRGFALPHEDGVSLLIARKNSLTFSFNYLARASSMESNFWSGYVARSTRATEHAERVTRMIYEHLGTDTHRILKCARKSGFKTVDKIPPFHRHLLRAGEVFR